ncbi:hypothetical protein [Micrococcus luteus]|uniref:hypothetical protein n=1 Tax=Micrococcus TaxID=1269 RepID=UPI0011A2C8EA|nr:hypothetical protein [Micrococcus luteus]MCV7563802.1 hypothetical protein [Micrococcus luteus]MCV7704046.1 hypothetical protein [Micrococcus luteus]
MPPRKVTKLTADVTLNPGGKDLMRAFHDGNMFSLGTFAALTDVRAAFALAQGEIARGIISPPAARPSLVDQTGARWGPLTGSPATAPTLSAAE